jgi:probable HAF family extracellular repeat protein
MDQLKRIIHSTVGKTLVISAFALSLLVIAPVAVDSQLSGVAEHRNHYSTASNDLGRRAHGFVRNNGVFTTIDAPGAEFFTVAFGIDGNGNSTGGYVDGSGKLHGFLLNQDEFTLIDYPGARATFAARMNDQGQIVGAYSNELNTPALNLPHGFLLHNGVFKSIDFPGARRTQPFGINNLGQIVGEYVDQNGRSHGFLWNNGVFTTIDAPGGTSTIAIDINDSGQIVGVAFTDYIVDGLGPAFLRDANGVFTRINIPGGLGVIPYGINNSGQIVGDYSTAARVGHGFLLDNGVVTNIDVPDATGFTVVYDINDGGQLAGAYDLAGHGYLKDTIGNFTTIDHPKAIGLTGEPIGINNLGQIVGAYTDANGIFHGFLRDERGFTKIDFPGAMLTQPYKINDQGQVVGGYIDLGGRSHGFLFDNGVFTQIDFPCPQPIAATVAYDIDNNGRIVGLYVDEETGIFHGFLRDSSGTFTSIDVTEDNAIDTAIYGINDQGQMTGVYRNDSKMKAFLLNQGDVTTIEFPGAEKIQPYSINNSGQIVGFYIDDGRAYGFLWVNGSFTTLTNPPGTLVGSGAYDIDDLGRIVGQYN